MNQKKAYVSPQVIRVKLEPTQAVLAHCSIGEMGISDGTVGGGCDSSISCKRTHHSGNQSDAS